MKRIFLGEVQFAMKNRNIGFGIFLLSLGLILGLINFGIIDWSIFNSLATLWPLIFVVIGLIVIFKDNMLVKIIAWLGFLAVLIFYGSFSGYLVEHRSSNTENQISIEKLEETKNGELKISLGGLKLEIDSGTEKLIYGTVSDPNIHHTVNYANSNETSIINIDNNDRGKTFKGKLNLNDNFCTLELNEDIAWNIEMKVGAVDGIIDMSDMTVRELDVDIGAGKLELIMGKGCSGANFEIDAGASMIDIYIPETMGTRIEVKGALSKTDLNDFNWIKDGEYYISSNYYQAKSKIEIKIKMGVGKLDVNMIK